MVLLMNSAFSQLRRILLPRTFSFKGQRHKNSSESDLPVEEDSAELQSHEELLREFKLNLSSNEFGDFSVYLIQPWQFNLKKHIAKQRIANEEPTPGFEKNAREREQQNALEESKSLCRTLNWNVVDSCFIRVDSHFKRSYLGWGQMERIKGDIGALPVNVSAIFLSHYRLTLEQRSSMEEVIGLPIIDRYNAVLQIFNLHARTKEAKLQVALAELPYIKSRFYQSWEFENTVKSDPSQRKGADYFEKKEMFLKRRETKLKASIKAIANQRAHLRDGRKKNKIPTVAVVGYTNSGKTQLIKTLTQSAKAEPEDKLFATLDVTVHKGLLPNNLPVLFVDTVGFISDIPTQLISSFASTLEDATNADVLLHIRDVSNPDTEHQNTNVLKTLKSLNISQDLLDNMIVVGNKIDKIEPEKWSEFKAAPFLPISATEGFGLNRLSDMLQNSVMTATERKMVRMRLRTGSPAYELVVKSVPISKIETDEKDQNYSLISAIVNSAEMGAIKKQLMAMRNES